jgi:hypothetical protein
VTVSRNSPPSAVRNSHAHGRTSASPPPVSMHLPTHARHRLRMVPLQSGAQEEDSVDRMEAKGCTDRRTQDTSKRNGSCARTQRQRRVKTHVQWREELTRVQDNNPRLDRPQDSPRPHSAPAYTSQCCAACQPAIQNTAQEKRRPQDTPRGRGTRYGPRPQAAGGSRCRAQAARMRS